MIGMKSILESASVEEGSIVAAGAVVTPGTVVGAGQVCSWCLSMILIRLLFVSVRVCVLVILYP